MKEDPDANRKNSKYKVYEATPKNSMKEDSDTNRKKLKAQSFRNDL